MGNTGLSIKWVMLVCVPLALACPGAAKKCSDGCATGTRCDMATQLCVKSDLAVTTESLADGKVGQSYSAPLAATWGRKALCVFYCRQAGHALVAAGRRRVRHFKRNAE
jgi:hypothetical protein